MSLPKPYYAHDGIVIYHGDCADVLPYLTAEAVISDPPYGVGVKYGAGFDDKRSDYWEWFKLRLQLMRKAAPVVVFTHKVKAMQQLTDWDWIGAWIKPFSAGSRLGNSPVLPHWEPIFLYGIHTIGTAEHFTSDVYSFAPQRSGNMRASFSNRESWKNSAGNEHPVPKPVDLYRSLIVAFGGGACA